MSIQTIKISATGDDGKTYSVIETSSIETTKYVDGSSSTISKLKSYSLANGDRLTPVEGGKFMVVNTNVILTIHP